MTLDSNGDLGLGTTTILGADPNRTVFTIGATTDAFVNFGTGSTRWGGIYASGTKTTLFSDTFLSMDSGGSERMRIDSSGNVGIGTSSPTQKLDISGNAAITGTGYLSLQRPIIPVTNQGTPQLAFQFYTTGTTYTTGAQIQAAAAGTWTSTSAATNLLFYTTPAASTSVAEVMRIDSSGNVNINATTNIFASKFGVTSAASFPIAAITSQIAGSIFQKSTGGAGNQILFLSGNNFNYGVIGVVSDPGTASGDVYTLGYSAGAGTAATPVLNWTSGNNVGIGKTPTDKPLEVYSASNTAIRIQNATTGSGAGDGLLIEVGGLNALMYNYEAGHLAFGTSGTERMRIDASGNVGIGLSSPLEKLHVNGTTIFGPRNGHFTGSSAATTAVATDRNFFTIDFNLNAAAIVRICDTGIVTGTDYFGNVYEYFITCYNGTVTVTLKQSQIGTGVGSLIDYSTGASVVTFIQKANATQTVVHSTVVDCMVCSATSGTQVTPTYTLV
jgi:hypothetical protein